MSLAPNDMATTASLLGGLGAVSSDSFTGSAAITGWQAHAMTGAEARLQDAWRGFVKTKVPWSKWFEPEFSRVRKNQQAADITDGSDT